MSRTPNDNEILAVHISRRDLTELIETLKKAEEICDNMRASAQDFRMQRIRLELLRQSSVPPPPPSDVAPERRESTRYVRAEDLGELMAKEKP